MFLLQGFRDWLKNHVLFGAFNQPEEDTYNQRLFEAQVAKSAQYRQATFAPPSTLHSEEARTTTDSPDPLSESPQELGETVADSITPEHLQRSTPQQKLRSLSLPEAQRQTAGLTVVSLFLHQAEGYINACKWDKAIAVCRKVLAFAPHTAEAHRLIGKSLQAKEQIYEALGYYADALVLQPESASVYADLGCLYHELEDLEQAITYYQKAVDLVSPPSTDKAIETSETAQSGLLTAQFQHQRQINQTNHQLDAIYDSLSLSPETFTAVEHCEMGHLLLRQNDIVNAMECFYRAIECQPSCVAAHLQLAVLSENQQKWQEAMVHYKYVAQATGATAETTIHSQISGPYRPTEDAPPSTFHSSQYRDGVSVNKPENGLSFADPTFAQLSWHDPLQSKNSNPQSDHSNTSEQPKPFLSQAHHQSHHQFAPQASASSISYPSTKTSPSVAKPFASSALTADQSTLDPLVASLQAFVSLARSYVEHGDIDKAVTHYRNALSLDPENPEIVQELTLVLNQEQPKN